MRYLCLFCIIILYYTYLNLFFNRISTFVKIIDQSIKNISTFHLKTRIVSFLLSSHYLSSEIYLSHVTFPNFPFKHLIYKMQTIHCPSLPKRREIYFEIFLSNSPEFPKPVYFLWNWSPLHTTCFQFPSSKSEYPVPRRIFVVSNSRLKNHNFSSPFRSQPTV